MYHETKMINGSLMRRDTPQGEWRLCTTVQLNAYIERLEEQLAMARIELNSKGGL